MTTTTGKTIIGYRYGGYWFGVRRGRIAGLSGASFASERELLDAYYSANGESSHGPGLIRVNEDGTELVLRPGDNNDGTTAEMLKGQTR